MNLYNIKLTIKGLLKNKIITAINIGGLVLGIAISMLVFSYVRKEKTMDEDMQGIEHVYTVLNQGSFSMSEKMVDHIRNEIPEIAHITYAHYEWSPQVFLKDMNTDYQINRLVVADSAFFKVFHFAPLYGNPSTALNRADQIVLTETVSRKIFGEKNPVGEKLQYNATNLQNVMVEVGAVIKDLSHHSSWNFEAILSIQTNQRIGWYNNLLKQWGTQNYSSFARISENCNAALINKKLSGISLKEVPEGIKDDINFSLLQFTDSYFELPRLDLLKHGNRFTLVIIEITGILILLLACINFINLVTAQKLKRLKNIGILKVLGGSKRKVISLQITESACVLAISSLLVLVITPFLLGELNILTNSNFRFRNIYSGWNLFIFIGVIAFTLLTTGIIPGVIFSKQQLTMLLKNKTNTNKKEYLRNSLLIFQFSISIVLMTSVFFIQKQNHFLLDKDPGFQRESILYSTTNDDIQKNILAFKDELAQIPEVEDITFSSALLGYNQANWRLTLINEGEKKEVFFANFFVGPNFFDFFGLNLKNGEQFNTQSNQQKDWILNESAMKKFGIRKLDDARLLNGNMNQGKIIAEVEDFNFESMHLPIRPVAFACSGEVDEVIYFKIHSQNHSSYEKCLASITQVWNKISPDFPLEMNALDTSWEALYKKEKQFQKILNYASIISILISCLGLLGLTFYVMERRVKEIGIHKVNGAKISEILTMLNKDFVKYVVIAFILACPVIYYAMTLWLANFAYKTVLSWWIFALAGILALGIALLTVSWHSWKAATRNPVEALRYE
ncbi:ABC transporter permease [Puteibacter caeruleilacunae]|nr:ABC transporter permease [Puteibacter caeruleilacunae]